MKILYIDDSEENIALLQSTLKSALSESQYKNFIVDTETDPTKGLAKLEDQEYDIVILDWYMPDIGGKEILEFMIGTYPETPVAILSAQANEKELISYTQKHNISVFSKPIEGNILVKFISKNSDR